MRKIIAGVLLLAAGLAVGSGFMPAPGVNGSSIQAGSIATSAMATTPVMQASASNALLLTTGTSFYAMVPGSAITLKRLTVAIHTASAVGAGDTWTVGSGGPTNIITVATANGAAAGTIGTTAGTVSIAAGTTVYMYLTTTATTRPVGTATLEYQLQ